MSEGKVVTLVKTDDDKVREVSDILRRIGAYDVESHRSWKAELGRLMVL